MTLRELIQSVDSEQYSESPLYQKLCETKPEYGSNRHIHVKLVDGEIAITRSTFGRFACKECSCRLEGNKVRVLHVKRVIDLSLATKRTQELPFLRIPRVLF